MLQRDLQWIKERVSAPLKYDLFLKKLFVADGKQTLGKFLGTVLNGGLMIRSRQEQESFTNTFSSILNTILIQYSVFLQS